MGKRFTLAPFANKLLVETISTVNLKLLQFDFQYLRRGGILYEAALRAGRQCEWGALTSGRLYYIWAVPSSPTQFSKAFALREQMSGTTAFHFSTEADCLVIADETESMQTSVPTEGEDQQCMQGSQDLQNNVIRPSSAAELRALKLAKLGVPPPAPLSPRDSLPPQIVTVPIILPVQNRTESTWKRHRDGVLAGATVVLEAVFEDERYAALLNSSGVSYQWYFEPNNRETSKDYSEGGSDAVVEEVALGSVEPPWSPGAGMGLGIGSEGLIGCIDWAFCA